MKVVIKHSNNNEIEYKNVKFIGRLGVNKTIDVNDLKLSFNDRRYEQFNESVRIVHISE